MALEYALDAGAGILHLTGSGVVTAEDRAAFFRDLVAAPGLPQTADVLVDVSAVSNTPSADDLDKIHRFAERLLARFGGRIAIVNLRPGHNMLSSVAAARASPERDRVRAFLWRVDALKWLRPE